MDRGMHQRYGVSMKAPEISSKTAEGLRSGPVCAIFTCGERNQSVPNRVSLNEWSDRPRNDFVSRIA